MGRAGLAERIAAAAGGLDDAPGGRIVADAPTRALGFAAQAAGDRVREAGLDRRVRRLRDRMQSSQLPTWLRPTPSAPAA